MVCDITKEVLGFTASSFFVLDFSQENGQEFKEYHAKARPSVLIFDI
jgi:hypothetical protein